jgi:hypothetical protein
MEAAALGVVEVSYKINYSLFLLLIAPVKLLNLLLNCLNFSISELILLK